MIPSNASYIYEARAKYDTDDVEIDDNPKVSRSSDLSGAFVQAWLWIPADDAREAQKVMGYGLTRRP